MEVAAGAVAPASEADVDVGRPGGHAPSIEAKGSAVPAPGGSDPGQAASAEQGTPGLETYQDIPVGFTEQGHPFMGDPKASVILEEYSDYLCPFCGRYFNQTFPQLRDQYVSKGTLKYVFRDFPLASLHPTAAKGSVAALCVAEQGAALFWAMHDELFRVQRQWSRLPDPVVF